MQIEVVNARARSRYGQFVSAMDMVLEALERVDPLIERVDDKHRPGGFTVATQDELIGYRRATFDALDDLRGRAKKYEAELVSRDWRL
ncbi:hypothetical protein [Amycolatopsis sp. H20-H5]|uniref:hypothetical protein n=1 Tax=Amycolatopsis sp. H20-H5 TaxID=3046309 RepID=UPI002DB569F4|nr:hypothetical protein [Amycolatopsis sp. H20-H5]MEC3974858.1 hypothetical protein [Amycolatopsis sp. H20-H5]